MSDSLSAVGIAAASGERRDVPRPPELRPPELTIRRLLRECMPIVFCHRGWMAAVAIVSLLFALLEPVQGIILKQVVDGLQGQKGSTVQVVLNAIPWYIAVLIGLALLSFAEKCLKGFYDPRLIFELQRIYLERRPTPDAATDVSRLQYDCMYGRKALEIFARDSWHILVTIGAVFFFQGVFAPAWLPALTVLTSVLAAAVLLFGIGVTRSNQAMFDAVEPVAACVSEERRHELNDRQMRLYRQIKWREAWMGASEVVMQLTLWIGCLTAIWIAPKMNGVMSATEMDAGGMALFVANLKIVSRPLIEIGKAYNNFAQTSPRFDALFFRPTMGRPPHPRPLSLEGARGDKIARTRLPICLTER